MVMMAVTPKPTPNRKSRRAKGALGGTPRVDVVILRFRQLQDLELKMMQYRTDVKALMTILDDAELEELYRRQPLLRDL